MVEWQLVFWTITPALSIVSFGLGRLWQSLGDDVIWNHPIEDALGRTQNEQTNQLEKVETINGK